MGLTQLGGDRLANHSLTGLDVALFTTRETSPEDSEGRPTQFTHTATVEGQLVTIVEAIVYDAESNPTHTFTQDKPEPETWRHFPLYEDAQDATRCTGYDWERLA